MDLKDKERFDLNTLILTKEIAEKLGAEFEGEVRKILLSGAVYPAEYNRNNLFRVALENMAEKYKIIYVDDYQNLKRI
jgi:hypothetical protein